MNSEGTERTPSNAVDRLVVLLAEEQGYTSIEIAEMLWLSTKIEPVVAEDSVSQDQERFSQSVPTPIYRESTLPSETPKESIPTSVPRANLTLPSPQLGVLPPKVLPVWVPDPPMLTDSLAVIRALKPLLQKVEVGVGKRLDESATVEATARTQLCIPILSPEQRPYFDVVIVVDRGSSMHIWQRLVKDIVRILKSYGIFWNVQVFDLIIDREAQSIDNSVLLISRPVQVEHRPSEVIDPQEQRIVVVLSDCAASYWWDGTLLPFLQDWGAIMPTVIWQMLPAWMWKRTALGRGAAAFFSSDFYGGANQRLTVQLQGREKLTEGDQRIRMPVVTSDIRDLSCWSRMVAGDRHEVTPGFVLPQQGGSVPRAKTYSDREVERQALTALARDRVERFLELSSPEAQRLVMLLAAAPVITLPVVRLIRDAMLHDVKSPLPIAEVFLSGLLQRLPGQTERELEHVIQESAEAVQIQSQVSIAESLNIIDQIPQETQDIVQYDFTPGVRPILLELLPAVDTISVINSVSAAVERRWKQVSDEDFRAFLMHPNVQVPEELEGMRAFGSVTADILEQLGGDYVSFAQTLRQGTVTSSLPPKESDFTIDPPQEDESQFPPPLQTEEFTIISIEMQPGSGSTQDLELFSFLVATIQHRQAKQQQVQTTEWEILRQQQETYRFRETLPGNSSLEMVAIPGGAFLMGSPEDEPEHQDDEFPQHEVTVEPFFMGAYPITQSQWRAVAELPQVERELDPDPSNFKGANRPVEQISWYDAVEFCARLSVLTNRQYRLPTEAEWEYACRAGTNTPFHFGETITSELANYDASSEYNGGPEGEDRGETTSVEYFGIANAFGLNDMHGNVLEWCQDYRHRNYTNAPTVSIAWIDGGDPKSRILRGGSWSYSAKDCRSAYRSYFEPSYRYRDIGFRVCYSNLRIE